MNRLWRTRTFERNRAPKEVLEELGQFFTGLSKTNTVQLQSIDTDREKITITYLVKPTHDDRKEIEELQRKKLAEAQAKVVAKAKRKLELAEVALHNILNETRIA